jgi:hypothetical protein
MASLLLLLQIALLTFPGIGAAEIAKLKGNNIHTVGVWLFHSFPSRPFCPLVFGLTSVQSLIAMTSKRLLKIKGFSDIKVEKIKDAAKKLMVSRPILFSSTHSNHKLAHCQWFRYRCRDG